MSSCAHRRPGAGGSFLLTAACAFSLLHSPLLDGANLNPTLYRLFLCEVYTYLSLQLDNPDFMSDAGCQKFDSADISSFVSLVQGTLSQHLGALWLADQIKHVALELLNAYLRVVGCRDQELHAISIRPLVTLLPEETFSVQAFVLPSYSEMDGCSMKNTWHSFVVCIISCLLTGDLRELSDVRFEFSNDMTFNSITENMVDSWEAALGELVNRPTAPVTGIFTQQVVHPSIKLFLRKRKVFVMDRLGIQVCNDLAEYLGIVPCTSLTQIRSVETVEVSIKELSPIPETLAASLHPRSGPRLYQVLAPTRPEHVSVLVGAGCEASSDHIKAACHTTLHTLASVLLRGGMLMQPYKFFASLPTHLSSVLKSSQLSEACMPTFSLSAQRIASLYICPTHDSASLSGLLPLSGNQRESSCGHLIALRDHLLKSLLIAIEIATTVLQIGAVILDLT